MGDEELEATPGGKPRRRTTDYGIPDWMKLGVTVAAATVTVILWANSNFISRAEMAQHLDQQAKDFSRVSATQEHYADAERGTAKELGEINGRLTRIETILERTSAMVRDR